MVDTEFVPRQQQFYVVPAMQQPDTAVTTSVDIKNMHYKRIQSFIQNHMQHESSESPWEQTIALHKSNR